MRYKKIPLEATSDGSEQAFIGVMPGRPGVLALRLRNQIIHLHYRQPRPARPPVG